MSNKRARISLDKAVVDVWQREVGEISARNFVKRLAASEDLVLRLDIYKKLDKHQGCVNTVSFNADGNVLVSGSDDTQVILWDWETGHTKLSFLSGHLNDVLQAKFMPYTDDRSLVTCAADGEVRHAQILERGVETRVLAQHQGQAYKLAIEPGSPHIFYTCGEDGLVQHIDLRTATATELFICCPIDDSRVYTRVINLNAITINPRNPNLFAVGGSDEYTRLYDLRKYKHLIGEYQVGITGLAFSDQSELLVSYNNEFIYLFMRDMGLEQNPVPSSSSACSEASEIELAAMDADPQVYKGHRNCQTVKGVNFFGPKSEYVVSGSDCGRIFIWKKKGGELVRVMEADKHVVNCIESHPHTTVLASCGIERDIKIWTPKAIEKAVLPTNIGQVRKRASRRLFSLDWSNGEEDDDDDDDDDDDLFKAIDDDGDDDNVDNDAPVAELSILPRNRNVNSTLTWSDDLSAITSLQKVRKRASCRLFSLDWSNGEEEDDDDDDDDHLCKAIDDDGDDDNEDNEAPVAELSILPRNRKLNLNLTCLQLKSKSSGRVNRITSLQDLMLQLLSWQSERQELMDLMLTFNINSDASSDDGGNVSGPEDLFS
ncbi:hypothetical protein ES319_A03G222600v1 [Gossypium barbadense]|uniref:Uncharacterized protein n=1 Tax=Gossypium barbadense TaxID=3634 RepID=A0A5J5WI73_GOSBA|nr:hypothetical protein ES319_A03G222600v1 [Gossypium barbadense]